MAPVAATVDSGVASGDVAPVAVVVDSVTSGDVAPVAVIEQCSRKRLLDTGSTQAFGKLCRRICTFLSKPPALLLVSGPTGCGKLTAAQHCVAHSAFGLVEIVNESAAATGIIQAIRRSGSMLTSTTNVGPSVIVVTGADGVQSGMAELLSCIRQCKKHVIIPVNSMVAFTTALGNEVFRCNWSKPWSYEALRATMDAVPGSDLLTIQEKGVMTRGCNDLRQLRIATEMLVNAKRCDFDVPSVMFALCDSPVHQWFNTLGIMTGKQLPAEQHNIGWISGSYLGGMQSTPLSLSAAAEFASNLTVSDMLSDDCEFGDAYSTLVLQHAMPLVAHSSGLKIQKVRLDLPRPSKRARYSATL